MGNSHFRSNILEQEDAALSIKFTNATFTNLSVTTAIVTATVAHVATLTSGYVTATTISGITSGHITTFTSNALTATTAIVPTLLSLTASNVFRGVLVASAALTAGVTARMLRINSAATVMYVKVYTK